MFTNNFDPVAIQILSLEIRWYSLAYIAGILIGWILGKKLLISNHKIKESFDDYITYLILGIIIGGRLGYVFFYNFNYYSNNPFDIIKFGRADVFSWWSIRDNCFNHLICKKKSQSI